MGLKRADLRDLTLIGWAIFVFVAAIAIHQSYRPTDQRDFVYFYSIGYQLNHYPASSLYDFPLQARIVHGMPPGPPKIGNPGLFVYPPHVALLFQPIARLSYWTACRLWLAICLALYLSGLYTLIQRFCTPDPLDRSLVLLFALAFWPMLTWVLLGGQLTAVAFLALALAVCWEDVGRHFLSGLALSICLYKPTLLLLLLPMLLVIRRPRTLAGFAAGASLAFAVPAIAYGPRVWLDYFAAAAHKTHEVYRVHPVTVDLRTLAGASSKPLVAAAALIAAAFLAAAWWKARQSAQPSAITQIWTATITWTLLLNVYVPVYDSVLVLIGLIAGAAPLLRHAPRLFPALCLALLLFSYPSTWFSAQTGWQLLTPALAAIGILQLTSQFAPACEIRPPTPLPGSATPDIAP